MRKIFCVILVLGVFQACGPDQKFPKVDAEYDLAENVKNDNDSLMTPKELTPPEKTS